jgi:PhnB protein
MSFNPYIHFQGNCREAMQAYAALFGGDLTVMSYKDAPEGPAEMKTSDLVMHSVLALPNGALLASDFPPGMEGDPQKAVTISHTAASVEQGKTVFDALAEGGFVLMPYGPTFWSTGFGMLKDRFGTHWMISAPH